MLEHHLFPTLGAIVLSFTLMSAHPVRADIHPPGADVTLASREDSAASLQRELDAFPLARMSVRDGIALAERRAAGSKLVDISFDGRNDRLVYNVKTIRNGKVWEGRIDASTGDIVDGGLSTPIDQFPSDDQRRIAGLDASKMGLKDAVALAETYGDGKAVSAGLNDSNGHLAFLIVVVSAGQLKAVSIDPTDAPAAMHTSHDRQPVSAR